MSKHTTLAQKRKVLAAKILSRKIGYLKAQEFSPSVFESIPVQTFAAHRIIRPKNELFVVQKGVVEIWRTSQDMFVTELEKGSIFGEMSLLGQTMVGCQAIAGAGGTTLGVMNVEQITEWLRSNPLPILDTLGARLSLLEGEHYKVIFQTIESRMAGLLLELAGEEPSVKGLSHGNFSEQLGTYRETVTNVLNSLKDERFIQIGRRQITLLNKRALRELSEL
jgi:CRP-like cAMP-binding protein